MENYGLSILDAERAIELCPGSAKGYYRRGCAYFCLLRLKEAQRDFQHVCKMSKDPNAESRLKECQKLIRQEKFSQAIRTEYKKTSTTIDIESITIPDTYKGPKYNHIDELTPEFLQEVITFLKEPKHRIPEKLVSEVLLAVIKQLEKLSTLVEIEVPGEEQITVCGDTHGQFYDLCNIFEINGMPSKTNPYLFNGDFVDRGSFSFEVIFTLFVAKLVFPNHMHLARGNHETADLNKVYGFLGEIRAKYNPTVYALFCESFRLLPLCHTINSKVFVVHGGLFSHDGVTLDDIKKIDRDCEPGNDNIMVDMLWSDPQPSPGRSPSKRGVSCNFGPDVTQKFLDENNLSFVIRSHEMKDNGYSVEHNGKMITIFSAPNYCDNMNNKGAFIRLKGNDLTPKYTTFAAVPHPPIPAMSYAMPLFNM